MKKYFLLAAAAATVLAVSCNKEKEQPKVDPTPGTEIEDNTPQPIRFGTNIAEVKAPITKSAIENHGWDGTQDLYIYGLEFDGTDILLSATGLAAPEPAYAPYINEVKAASPNPSTTGVREAIEVYKTYTSATNYTYYYYAGTKVYNFYAYYVGDAKQGTDMQNLTDAAGHATETADDNHKVSSIAIENLVIDGTNDIMIATTDKMADYAVVTPAPTVSLDKIYSATSARQGVVPDLVFQHQLSRFVFQTTYGGANNSSYAANRAKVKINSLKLKSPYKGTLTVYGQTPGFAAVMDNETEFTLEGIDANGVNPGTDTYGQYADLGTITGGKASILAVPKGDEQHVAKYDLILNVSQDNGNNNVATQDVPLEIDFSKLENATKTYAEAGKQYLVKIVVYGLEEIRVTVSLEEWGEGGDTTIDPDNNDPRPVPTITVTPDPAATLTLDEGATQQITATAKYGDPEETITAIKYGTTNKKVATVDANGLITAVKDGDCKIFVYVEAANEYQGAMKTINVHVNQAATPLPTATFNVTPSVTTWNFDANAVVDAAVATITSATATDATDNTTDVTNSFTITYSVEDNDFFKIDANSGTVTLKQNMSAVNPAPTANVPVEFTVTFTDGTTYQSGTKTFTITVTI